MSRMRELASHLAEFGGKLFTHDGWLARDAAGRVVDGHRYAQRVAHTCGPDCDDPCPGWHWHYVGRAFAPEDAVKVLADIVDGPECGACRGSGRRLHGWALCPRTCDDCAGTGRSSRPGAPS